MRNRNRYFLALGALFAVCGASTQFDAQYNGESILVSSAYAQDDEDPFGDDSSDEGDAAADSDDPFGSAPSSDPFAPSSLTPKPAPNGAGPGGPKPNGPKPNGPRPDGPAPNGGKPGPRPDGPGPNGPKPGAPAPADSKTAEPKADPSASASDDPRAKYLRAEDVPDEIKTEEDFVKTANAAERAILGQLLPDGQATSADLFSAAARIARVGRPLFAKLLVEKAAKAPDPTPEDASKILDSLGSGRATYFIAQPEVVPTASAVYEKIVAIARQSWESESALRAAIDRASKGSTSDQASAIVELRRGGSAAVTLLIQDLVSDDAALSAQAASLLPFFESDALEALLTTARNADADSLPAAIALLGEQQDLRVGPELLALLYDGVSDETTRQAVVDALAKQYSKLPTAAEFALSTYENALRCFKRTEVLPNTVDGTTEIWTWDAQKDAPVKTSVPTEDAYLQETARLAQLACRVGQTANALPRYAQDLAVAAVSELALSKVGPDSAADGLADVKAAFPDLSVDALLSSIQYSLDNRRYQAALIPTIWLHEVGDESIVYTANESSTIVKAALCADRRVRFEAISAIMQWNPQRSYVGASKVGRMLEWFATSTGAKIAVVASPKLDDCSKIGAVLQTQGYKILPVTTGRDAILAAQGCADVELVLATSNVSLPDARVIAQTLRADVRTYDVPLLVGTSEDSEDTKANLLVGREPNAFVYPKPYDLQSSSMALQRLFDYAKPNQVPAELREKQAKAAARAFLALSSSRSELYDFDRMNDITRRFLATPTFFDEGLAYASSLKTNYAQNALVELIGEKRYTADQRRQALEAFKKQLAENGSLLRGPEVAKMYDRYNASETEDAETQRILSEMLDVYEKATEK